MKNRKVRLLITMKCGRNCYYCCNKSAALLEKAVPARNLDGLEQYREIMITGGEPMLYPLRTLAIVKELYAKYQDARLYLYTALYDAAIVQMLPMLSGIQYSLHAASSLFDIRLFHDFQNRMLQYRQQHEEEMKRKTLRAYVNNEIPYMIKLIPDLWHRVEITGWRSEAECAARTSDEDYRILME